MDNSNLFSHPDAPELIASGEASGKPVEYPTFSDRPDAGAPVSATQQS
jgi:hypothetical protein